jgi:hypothetical protein
MWLAEAGLASTYDGEGACSGGRLEIDVGTASRQATNHVMLSIGDNDELM